MIQNSILTANDAIDINITPKISRQIKNCVLWTDAAGVSKNWERGERIGIVASFEYSSDKQNTIQELDANDETRRNIPREVRKLSVPATHFDRRPHTHHMVADQTIRTNQIFEFLTGRILTPSDPPSQQLRNGSTQKSQDNSLPKAEHSPKTKAQIQTIPLDVWLMSLRELHPSNDQKRLQC